MKFPEDLKLITFDLDDTLWPCLPVINRAENILYKWLCEHTPKLTANHSVDSLREHRQLIVSSRPEIAHNLTLTRKISLQCLLDDYGYDTKLAQYAIDAFHVERNKVTPYEDVIPTLDILKNKYQLIAVSNGNAEVARSPLKQYFHHALTAEEVGAAKPDSALFKEALRLANVTAKQSLHIGDDPLTDISAAHQIGIASIWINRNKQIWPLEFPPALHEIPTLGQLPAILKR